MKTKQEVEAYYEQSIDQDIWDAVYRAGVESVTTTQEEPEVCNSEDGLRSNLNTNSSKTQQSEPCNNNKECTSHVAERVEAWEEEFGRSIALYSNNVTCSADRPKVDLNQVKVFIRTLLDKARKEAKAYYELEYQNKVGAQEAMIAKVRYDERERCVEIVKELEDDFIRKGEPSCEYDEGFDYGFDQAIKLAVRAIRKEGKNET